MNTETQAVEATKAALVEAGRPDLANLVTRSRRGWPRLTRALVDVADFPTVIRAMWLGHLAGGHPASLLPDVGNGIGLWCDLCSEGHTGNAR